MTRTSPPPAPEESVRPAHRPKKWQGDMVQRSCYLPRSLVREIAAAAKKTKTSFSEQLLARGFPVHYLDAIGPGSKTADAV